MDIRSRDWLDVAACHTAPPEGARPPQVRLSDLRPDQKRELARLGLAAMASCAFLLTPLMLTGEGGRELPSTALAIQFAAAPAVTDNLAATAARSRPRNVRRSRARAAVARAALPSGPGVSAETLRPVTMQTAERTASVMLEDSDLRDERQQPASRVRRGVSRVLFGDGRYRVKPFPTPAEDQN